MLIKGLSHPEHEPVFRMPAVLGPASGPRNMPRSKAHLRFDGDTQVLAIPATSTVEALNRLLPERCSLLGEPILEAVVMCQKNLGWLAGRGYNIVALRIPVMFDGKGGAFKANFTPVLWENMADPILTGREELGSPKLFATIPDPLGVGDGVAASAEWEGFRFFDFRIAGLEAVEEAPPGGLPNLLYKYFSRTGNWQAPEVSQMTRAVPGQAPAPKLSEHQVGQGRFAFHPARWEDMPTQYTFINTLAELPLTGFGPARSYRMSGISDLMAQELVD